MNRSSTSRLPPSGGPDFDAEPTLRRIEPSHDALPSGTRLAEYEILSVLNEGRFGIVYLAMDHGLQRQVAIKEYLPAALASRGTGTEVMLRSDGHAETFSLGLRSFVDEARLLARFDHPALVPVYRFWEANGSAYMAMPYYEGETLDVVRQGMLRPPDEAWLRELLLPLLDALEVLHRASCYPRDISPENILVLRDGRPVLLGFGAARHVIGDRTQALTAILKPAFAPIEQYAESTNLRQGPWTNLYALAAVAYYCVSAEPPLASTVRALDDQMEPLSQVVDRLGRHFPELNYSVAFVSAIERALRVRPQERPRSVTEFRRALLGGGGAAESVMAQSAVGQAEPQEAPPAEAEPNVQSAPSTEEQNRFVPPAGETEHGSDGEPRDPALWAALEAALGPDLEDLGYRKSGDDRKAGDWRRAWLLGAAAVALVVLGAGGWLIWSNYRDAKLVPRATTPAAEPDERTAPLLPPVPPAKIPAQVPSGGPTAERQLPPPATAAPEAAPVVPAPTEEATVAEAPVEAPPSAAPSVREEAPSPPPLAGVVEKEPNNPRVLCGPRTQFSLYRCMKTECERPKYYDHPECKYLRVKDEVRALP